MGRGRDLAGAEGGLGVERGPSWEELEQGGRAEEGRERRRSWGTQRVKTEGGSTGEERVVRKAGGWAGQS